jgi:hypothetical protein
LHNPRVITLFKAKMAYYDYTGLKNLSSCMVEMDVSLMSDRLNGRLTSDWIIPRYARDSLWLESPAGTVRAAGEHGSFQLREVSPQVILRWSASAGPALAQLEWRPETLGWDGSVQMGGYVDAMHYTEIRGVMSPITILYMGGQPLKQNLVPYPSDRTRAHVRHYTPDFHTGLVAQLPEAVTTWLVPDTSPLARVARDAMVHNLRAYFFGRLADDDSGWGNHFGLPLMLEAITLFGP